MSAEVLILLNQQLVSGNIMEESLAKQPTFQQCSFDKIALVDVLLHFIADLFDPLFEMAFVRQQVIGFSKIFVANYLDELERQLS